jgi:hypothetical protein
MLWNSCWRQRWLCAGLLALVIAADRSTLCASHVPVTDGTVIISEFFEQIYRVDVASGTVTDALNSDPFDAPFGQLIEVLTPDSIALTSFRELHHYDVATHATALVKELTFNPREITRDGTGNLVAVGSPGVVHVDATTGAEALIFDDAFFSPHDVVVDQQGLLYLAEFFDALGVIDPVAGSFRKIGDFGANQFAHLDIGPDGFLYASSTFGGEFYRIHPFSGAATLLSADSTINVDDLQVAADGTLLFAGRHGSIDGVFALNPTSGIISTVINGTTINGGFFSTLDIDLYESNPRSSLPESSAFVLLLVGSAVLLPPLRPGRRILQK